MQMEAQRNIANFHNHGGLNNLHLKDHPLLFSMPGVYFDFIPIYSKILKSLTTLLIWQHKVTEDIHEQGWDEGVLAVVNKSGL